MNKFTLWLEGKYQLELTKANYAKVLANHSLALAVSNMLVDMEESKIYGMASNASGWSIQIRLHK